MSLSFWLIAVPTACYGLASVVYGYKGNWPLCVVYAGYMAANFGLLALDLQAR